MIAIPIAIALAALALIYAEFFVPGGVLASLGIVLAIASVLYVTFLSGDAVTLLVFIAALIIALALVIRLALYHVRHTKGSFSVYSDDDQSGYRSEKYDSSLIGKEGVVVTTLRPSGHIQIDDRRYQAVSRGPFVEKGNKVRVVEGRGAYLIVERKE